MSIADLGSLGEFVSSLAVLFTLIFLTVQMRQNTRAVKFSTAAEMTSQWLTNATSGATSPPLIDAMGRVNEAGTLLVQGGQHVFFFTASALKTTEFAHYQWNEGNLDERLWKTHESTMEGLVEAAYFNELWAVQRNWYTNEFQAYIESLMEKSQ